MSDIQKKLNHLTVEWQKLRAHRDLLWESRSAARDRGDLVSFMKFDLQVDANLIEIQKIEAETKELVKQL